MVRPIYTRTEYHILQEEFITEFVVLDASVKPMASLGSTKSRID